MVAMATGMSQKYYDIYEDDVITLIMMSSDLQKKIIGQVTKFGRETDKNSRSGEQVYGGGNTPPPPPPWAL